MEIEEKPVICLCVIVIHAVWFVTLVKTGLDSGKMLPFMGMDDDPWRASD